MTMITHKFDTSSSRRYRRALLTPVLGLALGAAGLVAPQMASAEPPAPMPGAARGDVSQGAVAPDAEITPKTIRRAVAEIKSSGAAYKEVTRGGQDYVVVDFDNGSNMMLPDVKSKADGGTNLGGGGGLFDPYVSFNRVDQAALIAGGGAALVGAICLIPAVGQVACVVAGVLVAMASVYVGAYGRCSTSYPNLRMYVYTSDRSKNGCYS